jgi:hypothetical protein
MIPGFTFIELPPFTKKHDLLGDHGLSALQGMLNSDPGDVMQGTGGARKVRVQVIGRNAGKSGGARVVYYFRAKSGRIYLFTIIDKKEKANLNAAEKATIKSIIDKLE